MGIFGNKNKKSAVPQIDKSRGEAILRCSICNGEQVLCFKDGETGEVRELMLIKSQTALDDFCRANGLAVSDIKKVY